MLRRVLASMIVLLPACGGPNGGLADAAAGGGSFGGKAAKFEMFVMSQCPYGVQVVNAIGPVKEKLGDALDLKIHYIGDGTVGALTSMHGPNEVTGDLAQVCAMQQAPDRALDMILCQNENMRDVANNWKDCATKVGIDTAALGACIEGDEGQKLLAASFAEAKSRGASGSPTMFLAGEKYSGGRKPNDFLRAVCATFGTDAPQACSEIPAAVAVSAIFFSDARCDSCDIHGVEPKLKGELPGLNVTYVDYGTPEGKALFAELQAADPSFKFLPTVLLGAEVDKDVDGVAALKRYLRPLGKYQELRLGGEFDPTAEICDNTSDDDGDGQIDCADSGCKEQMVCRETIPNKVDMFVMSQCPYGAKAMIAAHDVMKAFGGELDINVHFIGDNQGGQLSSMHGPSEVDEDLREICAAEHYAKGEKYLGYLACRSRDYKSEDWKPCATEAGLDAAVIERCASGDEGKKLLADSFAFAQSLGISASPTFLGNNKRTFNAIAADTLQQQICQDNPSLKGCAGVVVASPGAEAPVDPAACGN